MFGQLPFDNFYCLRRARMGAQVITEQQWVQLVWSACYTYMNMGSALPFRLHKEELLPIFGRGVCAWRNMIFGDFAELLEPNIEQRLPYLFGQCCHGDLHVNHIFGSQPRHRSRADVVNAQRQRAKRGRKSRFYFGKFLGPTAVVS